MELNIETLVEAQVKRELEETDIKGVIEATVRDSIRNGVGKEIISGVNAVAKHMIAEEVRKALDGEVRTDDGWGKRNVYTSFEELFRATFKKAIDDKYEVKKEIERLVKQRVESLIKQDYNRILEKIVDDITASKLVKKDG